METDRKIQTSFVIEKSAIKKLDLYASKHDISRGKTIRRIIKQFFEQN